MPRNSAANMPDNMRVVQLLLDWGVRKGATPAQLSLAWLKAQKPFVVPIPTNNRTSHLLENIGSEEVRFTAAELREFTTALNAVPVRGARLSPGGLAITGVEAPLP